MTRKSEKSSIKAILRLKTHICVTRRKCWYFPVDFLDYGLNTSPLSLISGRNIAPKPVWSSNLLKFRLSDANFLFAQLFWDFAPDTTAILSCSVQNLKLIGKLHWKLWENVISRDLCLRKFRVGLPCWHTPSDRNQRVSSPPFWQQFVRCQSSMRRRDHVINE